MLSRRSLRNVVVIFFVAVIGVAPTVAGAANNPSGDVTVSQSVLDSLIGEPERHFHRAVNLYDKGDAHGAASEVRAAAALVRMEAGRGNARDAAQLRTAATALQMLAANVATGDVASRRDLYLAFARADLALAAHYRSMADQALTSHDRVASGRWLKAAGDCVDDAAAWTGRSPSGVQAETWDQMHALQTKIRTGANWSYDEARKGVGYLGAQIQYLGQQMQSLGGSGANRPSN